MAQIIYTVVAYQHVVEITTVLVTLLITVCSLDDLFLDLCFWVNRFYRWFWVRARYEPLPASTLLAEPERPIAIMVPAWKEHDVIYSMLRTNVSLLEYRRYRFFVGVYCNDPDTIAEVTRAVADMPQVQMVLVPRPGPTSKADCLNEVIEAIRVYEQETGVTFAGIALHDSEDVIHPYELKLFNYLLDRHDLIQLPVFSFQRNLQEFVAGTYMDEFAEVHSKDLVVRELLTGIVPCAGVSACFSRRAVNTLRMDGRGEVFRLGSLTEDYDIAFRLHEHGMSEIFVRFPVKFTMEASSDVGQPFIVEKDLPIATREYFPSDFRAAYRQRARWLLGIVFQGWSQHGWRGNTATKYFFIRDRKGVLTAPLAVLGYICIFNVAVLEFLFWALAGEFRFGFILLQEDWYRGLLLANLLFLANRLVQRTIFTARIYGLAQGLLAGPRMIVSNFLNFFAVLRAVKIFAVHRATGKSIVWDKTQHTYPAHFAQAPNLATPAA